MMKTKSIHIPSRLVYQRVPYVHPAPGLAPLRRQGLAVGAAGALVAESVEAAVSTSLEMDEMDGFGMPPPSNTCTRI